MKETLVIPNIGNYSIAFAAVADALGAEAWNEQTTTETINQGCKAAPDCLCLPFKSFLGRYMCAAKQGVKYGVMTNSMGPCRLRYYRELQQTIIDEHHPGFHIFGLGFDGIKPPLIKHFDPKFFSFFYGCFKALQKVFIIDQIEQFAWKTRARELVKGETTKVMNSCLKDLQRVKSWKEIRVLKKSIPQKFEQVAIDKDKKTLKIALVGECLILRDKYLNHNIEDILGGLGVEVNNFFLLGAELMDIFNVSFKTKHSKKHKLKVVKPYLNNKIGGHALDSVYYAMQCARAGYDGIIHLCPTGCMPEISVRPVLRKVCQDFSIPVMECSFDEHTSHVGMVTRLEAFIDMINDRKDKNEKNDKRGR